MINDPSRNSKYSGTFVHKKSPESKLPQRRGRRCGIRLSSSALCGGFFLLISVATILEKMMMRRRTMDVLKGVIEKETREICELAEPHMAGKTVRVNGAVHTIRDMGRGGFCGIEKAGRPAAVCV